MSKNSHIPVIKLALFDHNKVKKTLQLSSEPYGIPEQFYVESHKTGRTVLFVQDIDDMMSNEFYDGEAVSYKPAPSEYNCNILRAFIVNWM